MESKIYLGRQRLESKIYLGRHNKREKCFNNLNEEGDKSPTTNGVGLYFDITVDKDKRVYCFIGDNAVGKTNLLENLARTLLYCHTLFQKPNTQKYSGIFFEKEIYEVIKDLSLRLATGDIRLNQTKINGDVTVFKHLSNRTRNMTIDKPIVFIGAKRLYPK